MAIDFDKHIVYKVKTDTPVLPHDPLHVGNFYKDKQKFHKKSMDERQALILYLAKLHREAMQVKGPIGFKRIPICLTRLRKWVYDYRIAFDCFFDVVQLGYNIDSDNKELTIAIPKPISISGTPEVFNRKLFYEPPSLPNEGAVSKVWIQFENADYIYQRLNEENRFDLKAPVDWLLNHPTREVNFWFVPSGQLKLRDTSIWPIHAIETWPGWLRVALFGEGVDIESAYSQYLIEKIRGIYSVQQLDMYFPNLMDSLNNKKQWRLMLCDTLKLPHNDESIKVVKNVCMGLANGSKISGQILAGTSNHSQIKETLLDAKNDYTVDELYSIGAFLGKVGREYSHARKIACLVETKKHPSKQNQKSVFRTYFQWERDARYRLWEAVGRKGIMVHDGIDGIPTHLHEKAIRAIMSVGIKAS